MKKLIFTMITSVILITTTNAQKFDLMPLGMDFNGIVVAGHHVICYSNNGNYLMTTDRGLSWEQYALHPFGNIKQIENRRDTLWGIIDEGIVIRSYDMGFTWDLFPFHLDSGDRFRCIALSDEYIYVRKQKEILKFDKQINKLASYINERLFCDRKDKWSSEAFSYMGFCGDSLFISISNVPFDYDGDILILDENLSVLDTIVLKHIFPNLVENNNADCRGLDIKGIQKFKNRNVFIVNYLPFFANSDYSKWDYIYNDDSIGKTVLDSAIHYSGPSYIIYKDDIFLSLIYHNINNDNAMMKHLKFQYQTSNVFCNIGIRKYNNQTETFDIVGKMFENRYYTVGNMAIDALSRNIWVGKFVILEDSIFIFQGGSKSIVQSRNSGQDWELISHYNKTSPFFIFNDTSFIALSNYYPNHIFSSSNGGKTFIPPIIDTADYYPYFQVTNNPALLYIDSTGKGFFAGAYLGNLAFTGRSRMYAITEDFGRTFRFFDYKSAYIHSRDMKSSFSNVIHFEDKAMFISSMPADSILIYTVDFKEKDMIPSKLTTHYNIKAYHLIADNLRNYLMLARDAEKAELVVQETLDSGFTFTTIKSFGKDIEVTSVYEHNKDSLFISANNPPAIYLYERKPNTFTLLYADNSNTFYFFKLVCISDKFFIATNNGLLKNSDRGDLSKWIASEWDYGTPKFSYFIFKGNVGYASLRDSLRPSNYYRITLDKDTLVSVDYASENQTIKHFYAANPRPLPAVDKVSTMIYWDTAFDITKAKIEIYNIMGVLIEKDLNISVINAQQRSAELVWNCTGVQPGVYLIVINFNGVRRSVPVVVAR